MQKLFLNFKKSSVLIIGDIILDEYIYGKITKFSTESCNPILKIKDTKFFPGGAANVAMNAACLGSKVYLLGIVGTDKESEILKKKLGKKKVFCEFLFSERYPTIKKTKIFSEKHTIVRIDREKQFLKFKKDFFIKKIQKIISKVNVIIVSDYQKGTVQQVQDIIKIANKKKVFIFIDPKGKNFDKYKNCTLLKPNLQEFQEIVGKCKNKNTIIKKAKKMISKLNLSNLLITCSEKGMIFLQKNGSTLYLPSITKKVVDTNGAGDTVISVLAVSISSGKNFQESIQLANIASGIAVQKFGTSYIKKEEIETFLIKKKKHLKIIRKKEIKKIIQIEKKKGKKIVMTNGVFDIIHAGHIKYLKQAKSLGDRLIVAVNSDKSTKVIKGSKRPINSLCRRMQVLSELRMIDWIVSFQEDCPKKIISLIKPDVLVKGGDYKNKEIIGKKEVLKNGGEVIILDLEKNISTTKIINLYKNYCKSK
ncbi:bifunctional D-glycero-beta-D-manno-heptose-7-phosphate kinase/D-glycero-beta-D-manno-heptose 1-phosphate adenylyltransferase HldE [bacterium endosymbiont of Pedicinus badii]|uniref:bifunctional D-glycero-beta-D-manno-heptose-7-phosphate kinase/D-glycero-beta-D-manno-heptose 1-phosphate adenylyltransferase HldE n=1 Tax=bacterium endosymbiont of Pedicinus badii TaxID=1719126 RepID=UPI0009B9D912|nr:bifunctional D-glycero-beta-D-manno-heptose-7-phosphate kinase/D-glycero-beta-D-manno-heptose 1-phosphate adenylyltransferase HldE [bacterium endosymbiont of Pedicinus badii]OQM34164.1 hypothetical protein AOQ89_02385 [bacterium endosymbiont of Pedicinus badii]